MDQICLNILDEFCGNAKDILGFLNKEVLKIIVNKLVKAKKIFVLGIGHSGMFGRIFAMKLNHVGLKAYTVFDEINPPFTKNDLFFAISQSGETDTIITLAKKAKKIGGEVISVTSDEKSSLALLSDDFINVDKISNSSEFTILGHLGDKNNQNLLGALFGFNIYIIFYAIIIMIAIQKEETSESINSRHANLQ